jgi:hypothetical protein
MVLDHAIFTEPYAVMPTLVAEQHDRDETRTIETWKVFEASDSIEIGLVSNRDRLATGIDTEILSGGVNSKGDRGIALAREANLFQWGFTGPPAAMTDEARRVFVNAVCYIAKFDGRSVWADAAQRARRIEVEAPRDGEPVTAAVAVLEPSAKRGDTVTLAVRVNVAFGWHVYADVPAGSAYPTTKLDLELPDGVEADGDWQLPPSTAHDGAKVWTGELTFTRKLRVGGKGQAHARIGCEIRYQVCNEEMCLPPAALEVSTTLPIR